MQAGANWFDILKTGLESRSYHQCHVEPFVSYRKDSVILIYVDGCILVSHKQETIASLIESLNIGFENYVLTDEGDISICNNVCDVSSIMEQ